MKHLSRMGLLAVLIYSLAFLISCQQGSKDLNNQELDLLTIAREIVVDARYCALISLDSTGHPQVRTMDPFKPDSNFVIWLGSNPSSRKIQQIQNDSRVTLYYFSKDNDGYVSFYGNAKIIEKEEEKTDRFKEDWKDFYDDQKRNYILIKFVPDRLELISTKHDVTGDSLSWKPSVYHFKDDE